MSKQNAATCLHEHSIFMENYDLLQEEEVATAIEHGNLSYVQQIEDRSKVRTVTISTSWCPECNAIYGEITAVGVIR